jgi:hypothetical protein
VNPVHRTLGSFIFLAIVFEAIGFAAGGSLNPVSFFTEANTVMLVVLCVLATLMFFGLLTLLGLWGLRAQGLTPDHKCGYSRCPLGGTPLWATIGFAPSLSVVRCEGSDHQRGREWFHRTCWALHNGRPPSLGHNLCKDCMQAQAGAALLKWD